MDVVEQHEAEDRADPRDRVQPIPGGGVMVLGRFDEAAFDVAPQRILGGCPRINTSSSLRHGL